LTFTYAHFSAHYRAKLIRQLALPIGTTGDNVKIITDRLQKVLELHNAESTRSYKLSISFGVAHYDPENPCSIDELLLQGDKLMYEQKRLKRGPSIN